jgi:hypothetical protein
MRQEMGSAGMTLAETPVHSSMSMCLCVRSGSGPTPSSHAHIHLHIVISSHRIVVLAVVVNAATAACEGANGEAAGPLVMQDTFPNT